MNGLIFVTRPCSVVYSFCWTCIPYLYRSTLFFVVCLQSILFFFVHIQSIRLLYTHYVMFLMGRPKRKKWKEIKGGVGIMLLTRGSPLFSSSPCHYHPPWQRPSHVVLPLTRFLTKSRYGYSRAFPSVNVYV